MEPEEQGGSGFPSGVPFKTYETIYEQETAQAVEELHRPARGLFISGIIAGVGVGLSVLLLAVILTQASGELPELLRLLLYANAYAVGFIIVIMARTDLFTEYSTIAILPVLTGEAPVAALLRLWGFIYAANLVGGASFAALIVAVGPALGVMELDIFARIALDLTHHSGLVILGSALLTGWFMGLLSWLIVAARDNISQVFFIWLIGGSIGFAHLHHVITGAIEVMVGVIASASITLADFGHFLLWTTVGNITGGVIFAVMIRFSVLRDQGKKSDQD